MPSIFRDAVKVTDLATGSTIDLQAGGFITDILDGWNDTPGVNSNILARGNANGARRGSRWSDKEKYLTLGGAAYGEGDRNASENLRDLLFDVFRPQNELAIDRRSGNRTRRMFVSTYDKITCDDPIPDGFRWTIPLVALDPSKYGDEQVTGEASAFSGDQWYRVYDTATERHYIDTGFTGTAAEVVARTNLVRDPRPEFNQTWTASQSGSSIAVAVDTDIVYTPETGPASRRVIAETLLHSGALLLTQPAAMRSVLPVLDSSFQVRVAVFIAASTEETISRNVQLNMLRYNSGGSLVGTQSNVVLKNAPVNTWTILDAVVAPVSGTSAVAMQVQFETWDASDTYYVAEPIIVAAPSGQPFTPITGYFDGSSSIDGDYWHRWTGTVGNSVSQRYQPARNLPGRYGRIYIQPVAGERPSAATLVNAGNISSRRVKLTLYGPLPQDDWEVVNETTGESFFIDFPLVNALTPMVIDTFSETVTFGDNDLTALLYGNWISLDPGVNTVRLRTGAVSLDSYLTVEAYSSWR